MREIAHEVLPASSAAAALTKLEKFSPELVLVSEDGCPTETGCFVRDARSLSPQTPVVVVSEEPDVDRAVRLIRAGALDYIRGPLDRRSLQRLIEGLRMQTDSDDLGPQRFFCDPCPPGVKIVGRSPGMVQCLETIRLVSESRCSPVLILGETGVGKELVARAVHYWRYGDFDRFVAVNCAALTSSLLESELFGHEKGAFTGADREKTGLFEHANGGSIFLDEISEMPPELQAKLLRVLQEKTFRRVGGTTEIPCDATVIVSSNRPLFADAQKGKFRLDLYYRLAVFPITVPPLRHPSRRDDISLLAEYLLETLQVPACGETLRLGRQAERRLLQHDWPGNVRELRNVIQRAIILEESEEISVASLLFDASAPLPRCPDVAAGERPREDFSLEAAEREFILRALQETGWQRTQAAALLGITRATLHAKLKRYEIQPPGRGASGSDSATSPQPSTA